MVLDEVGVVENNGSIFGYITDVFRRFEAFFVEISAKISQKMPKFWYQNLGFFG